MYKNDTTRWFNKCQWYKWDKTNSNTKPASNFTETYLAAHRVESELNPAYNHKTSGL